MKESSLENEIKRRRKVAMVKALGALIESLERGRMTPLARSIAFRLVFLHQSVEDLLSVVKAMGLKVDPMKTKAPLFTVEQANILIETYNSVIRDIKSHFAKKDSYISSFSAIDKLEEPTINEVAKNLFIMGINILQILSYLVRWVDVLSPAIEKDS